LLGRPQQQRDPLLTFTRLVLGTVQYIFITIGGGENVSNLVGIGMENENILNSLCVIVLDLSKIHSLLKSFKQWITCLRNKTDNIITNLNMLNPFAVEQAKRKITTTWQNNDD
jgi:hypothetical protein